MWLQWPGNRVRVPADKHGPPIATDYLDSFGDSIEKVLSRGNYFTIWWEFEILRIAISGGYRFVMPGCHNAITWSVTTGYDPHPEKTTIHVTIHRPNQDPDFVETLVDFTEEWRFGLEKLA
ncbi:MAG: hypothetical protein HQL53_09970 [Magnetococcales bacterium]|nr:hypothetical protein [Magnetococcales bacterium]